MYSELLVIVSRKAHQNGTHNQERVTGSKSKTANHRCEPKLRLSQMVTVSWKSRCFFRLRGVSPESTLHIGLAPLG